MYLSWGEDEGGKMRVRTARFRTSAERMRFTAVGALLFLASARHGEGLLFRATVVTRERTTCTRRPRKRSTEARAWISPRSSRSST
eukprot:31032-Pelagococcus_subviridis.AAC.3